jgi:cobalt-zinc-cadmium efflux system protein
MAKAGYGLVKESWRILLEPAPQGLDQHRIGAELADRPGGREVHDLHIWTITFHYPALAAHVLVEPDRDCHKLRVELQDHLRLMHGISHVTLQVDHARFHQPEAGEEHCADPHEPVRHTR